jgi:hypothetical protein
MDMVKMKACYQCKKALDVTDKIGRTETCPFCDADLHCCLNCRFYDSGAYNECCENQAERVLDKDRSNFCDYFSFRHVPEKEQAAAETGSKKDNPLDTLFKK